MHGVAVEKSQAQEDYEQAISEGDSPIMLERIDLGLYCLNVGNILAGEQVVVTIEFMEVLTLKADECDTNCLPLSPHFMAVQLNAAWNHTSIRSTIFS